MIPERKLFANVIMFCGIHHLLLTRIQISDTGRFGPLASFLCRLRSIGETQNQPSIVVGEDVFRVVTLLNFHQQLLKGCINCILSSHMGKYLYIHVEFKRIEHLKDFESVIGFLGDMKIVALAVSSHEQTQLNCVCYFLIYCGFSLFWKDPFSRLFRFWLNFGFQPILLKRCIDLLKMLPALKGLLYQSLKKKDCHQFPLMGLLGN